MNKKAHSALRKLPCGINGTCQEKSERMSAIEDLFKKRERDVLGVINSYIHNQNDPFCEKMAHDNRGYSVLHLAAERNLLPVAEKLLESGFNPLTPGCKENAFKLALHVAIEMGFDKMAALITRHIEHAVVRDLFVKIPEHNVFMKCKKPGNSPDVLSVNYLIQRDCVFVKTIQAVLDSLKDVHENNLCTVYVKLLEEDGCGLEPINEGFDYHYHTVFHNLTHAQKEVANHPVIAMLIDYKWKAWARWVFVSFLLFYLMSLFSLTFAIVTGVMADDVRTYDTPLQYARAVFEIAICILALYKIVAEFIQMKRHKLVYLKQFFNWNEILSSACILIVVLLRYTTEDAHWFVLAVAYLLWVLRIFNYAVVSRQTGVYAESLRQIMTKNFVPFSLLFFVVNLTFCGVFLLVLKGEGRLNTHDETSTMYGIWIVGLRTMIEAGPIVEYTGSDGYGPAGTVVMLVFMATTIVVLLNILIAQLSDTYSKVQVDAAKSVKANRVSIITGIERNEWQACCLHIISLICGKRFDSDNREIIAMSNRTRHYKSVFTNVDLHSKHRSFTTPIEEIQESIYDLHKLQIQIDLKANTIKTRLRELEAKMKENFKN